MEVLASSWMDKLAMSSSTTKESHSAATALSNSRAKLASPFLRTPSTSPLCPLTSSRPLHAVAKAARATAAVAVATTAIATEAAPMPSLLRPTPAEAARTIMEVCVEGTLSTLSDDGWPLGTEVRFAVDLDGNPVFRLQPSELHTRHLLNDSRCSLHVQLEQPGRQKPQCTLRGHVVRVDDSNLKETLELVWARRFGKERTHDDNVLYVMNVEQALQAQDMGEEETWVTESDYRVAIADPLRECAPRIVEDMNRKHWEDIRRFCNVYAKLEAELEEASMTWVDRLGFDMRVLTHSPQNILEIRIPFPREVTDERDARSSLTIMAQIAWEQERNYSPS